ncbi:hypothetical protein [Aliamphritea hakodatensis]|uniref:hypothetical protein n=1 Tax=Aliamphritea hakodatensis TaxID=2895352 RepID=UPI0022FD9C3D|nr:hypothetical protein [Aliamphritea hakodatensis]
MTEDQKIYQEIGKALWSLMPDNAQLIYCIGMVYSDTHQIGPEWVNHDGSLGQFDFENYPDDFCADVYQLVVKLQELPPYERQPWSHFKASLTEEGRFKMDFAYIPQADSWPGLFMKGVSDLSWEEAQEHYIPQKDWEKCIADREANYK